MKAGFLEGQSGKPAANFSGQRQIKRLFNQKILVDKFTKYYISNELVVAQGSYTGRISEDILMVGIPC